MAADGSWPSIASHGLLSTAALVELWEVADPNTRSSLLDQRRADSIAIEHRDHGIAIVRVHKRINELALVDALIDMTPEEWFEVLNERVFFFLQRPRLESLIGAYSKTPQIVITLDTASLVAAHEAQIELCQFNSGFAQPHNKKPRDRGSFLPIADFPHPQREVANPRGRDIAELTVLGGVPDVAEHVISVDRVLGGQILERLV